MSDSTFLTRVELLNYKSITHCSVKLGPLMFLVGPNGAGKSNFLDALHFISDALNNSLDYAIRQRGGIRELKRRGSLRVQSLRIRLEFSLPTGEKGTYLVRIRQDASDGDILLTEECRVHSDRFTGGAAYFHVDGGKVKTSEGIAPVVVPNRLYLVAASGLPAFLPVFEALSRMTFYNLNTAWPKEPHPPDSRELLASDGSNITSILKKMNEQWPETKKRTEEYLAVIVRGIQSVGVKNIGSYEILEFMQQFREDKLRRVFPASSMSDGTLRALGILIALFQKGETGNSPISLAGIEEPETGLHPAATGALLDAIGEASESKQILVTSHSADLLDNKNRFFDK